MDIDPRAALDRLIEALTAHYEAVTSNQNPEAPAVVSATAILEDAFVTYDDALITNFDVDLPFDVYDADFDEEFDEDEDLEVIEDDEEADDEDLDDDEDSEDDEQ